MENAPSSMFDRVLNKPVRPNRILLAIEASIFATFFQSRLNMGQMDLNIFMLIYFEKVLFDFIRA